MSVRLAVLAARSLATDCEGALSADHPHTLTAHTNLTYAYQDAGRTAEAIPLYERALADFARVMGADHRRCGPGMRIRVYDGHPTVSVVRGGDAMLVTPYMRFFIGSNSPTFEFRAREAPRMFTRYTRHFEVTWTNAEDWHR